MCEGIRAGTLDLFDVVAFFGFRVGLMFERRAGVWLQEASALTGQAGGRTLCCDGPDRCHRPAGRGRRPAARQMLMATS